MRSGCKAARRGSRVMAIGDDRSSAGAKIVVGVRSIEGCRHLAVPDQVIRELVLPLCSHHVGLVLVGTKRSAIVGHERAVIVLTGIAGRAESMRPAEVHTVERVQFLAHDKPRAPPRTLILECQISRDIAVQVFDDATNRGPGRKLIHDAGFCGPLIRDILKTLLLRNSGICAEAQKRRAVLPARNAAGGQERHAVSTREVALPVDILMPFSGGGHIKRAVGVTNIGADRIVERAITARDKCISAAGRIVAAGTVGFTLGNVAAVIVAGLTR